MTCLSHTSPAGSVQWSADAAAVGLLFEASDLNESRPRASRAELDHLARQHIGGLYKFVRRKIRHHADAEDIAQQTFVEAARCIGAFRGEAQLATWLYGIASNLVRNHLVRSPQRRYLFEDDGALMSAEAPACDPCRLVQNDQLLTKVQQAIEALPDDMRTALLLVSVEELSYEEAASRMAVPIGTVRSRVSRARCLMRTELLHMGIEA